MTKTKSPALQMTVGTASAGPSRLERMRAKLADNATPAERATPAQAEGGRRVVAIDKVVENPGNERKTFRGMDGIKATVDRFGILEPPTVEPREDGTYLLVTGHRRARAARELGHATIEVLVRSGDDAHVRRRKSLVSNVQHQDVDAVELAEGLQALLDEDPSIESQADLANAIGKSRAWVSETIGILRLAPHLQVAVKASERQLPYDALSKIAREEPAFQEELVGDLLAGGGIVEIRGKISDRKAAKGTSQPRGTPSAKRPVVFDLGGGATVTIRTASGRPTPREQADLLRAALAQIAGEPKLKAA